MKEIAQNISRMRDPTKGKRTLEQRSHRENQESDTHTIAADESRRTSRDNGRAGRG